MALVSPNSEYDGATYAEYDLRCRLFYIEVS